MIHLPWTAAKLVQTGLGDLQGDEQGQGIAPICLVLNFRDYPATIVSLIKDVETVSGRSEF